MLLFGGSGHPLLCFLRNPLHPLVPAVLTTHSPCVCSPVCTSVFSLPCHSLVLNMSQTQFVIDSLPPCYHKHASLYTLEAKVDSQPLSGVCAWQHCSAAAPAGPLFHILPLFLQCPLLPRPQYYSLGLFPLLHPVPTLTRTGLLLLHLCAWAHQCSRLWSHVSPVHLRYGPQ